MDPTTQSDLLNLEHRQYYPKPAAPISPVLSCASFSPDTQVSVPTLLDLPNTLQVTSGRAAIVLALEHAGITRGDQVLVPAYHCESMISPVRHVGATPVFYKINEHTLVDLQSCEALLNNKIRAIIITHYFGFPQKLDELRTFCDTHHLIMIEDCAHSLFGKYKNTTIGSFGDYAIASTMKFYPVFDGGILASAKLNLDTIMLAPPSLSFELKSTLTTIERALDYGRFGTLGKIFHILTRIKDRLWGWLKSITGQNNRASSSPSSADGGFGLDPEWINIIASKATRFIVNKGARQRIISLRKQNYKTYAAALNEIPGCHPLHPELTDTIVPLVFAVRFDNAEAIFDRLKKEAVPIWRFGEFLDPEVTKETCAISYAYSKSILQFPCHQEMLPAEINWIIEHIKSVCTNINQ